jgi:hypothetical protein
MPGTFSFPLAVLGDLAGSGDIISRCHTPLAGCAINIRPFSKCHIRAAPAALSQQINARKCWCFLLQEAGRPDLKRQNPTHTLPLLSAKTD